MRQLTTGDDVYELYDHDAETCSICGPTIAPLFPQHPLAACRCRYGLHPTIWCPTHLIDVPGVGQRGGAYTFRIHPKCPHHGDARLCEGCAEGIAHQHENGDLVACRFRCPGCVYCPRPEED